MTPEDKLDALVQTVTRQVARKYADPNERFTHVDTAAAASDAAHSVATALRDVVLAAGTLVAGGSSDAQYRLAQALRVFLAS